MLNKRYMSILFLIPFFIFAQAERVITDEDIPAGSSVTFSSDTTYILNGMVFVDSAATLTIEAGTLIKAEDGTNENASGLVVTRHAKIYAEGTAARPIIFTSVLDDGSLLFDDRGLWGGVVLLGQAPTNNGGDDMIEGVNEIDGHRSLYGGNDSLHSSGVFRYVSIRHTGINIGESTGNEIQGLTLGAVGAGTVLEYVESYSSDDDGFEFFGGTVNTRYLVSAFCADDAFDWDQGFRGKHQFWFAIQAADAAGRVAEMDGAGGNEQGTPYAHPVLSNVTYIGAGTGATPVGDGSQLLMFRDNTGGVYMNSIFTDYQDKAITVEDVEDEAAEDSRKRLEGGDLVLAGNMWYGFAPGNMLADLAPQDYVQTHLTGNNNRIEDPMLRGISRETDAGLDPRPQAASPALSGALEMDDDYFVQTAYVGAFGGNNWLRDWTALDQLGYVSSDVMGVLPEKIITDEDIPAGSSVTFSSDTTYILNGMVFVDSAATLTIEAGTLIKAEDGTNENASGLVVTRHAKIFAEGTAARPIIFTSVLDDGSLLFDDRGLWGGVVLLGQAPTNNGGDDMIEGVNEIDGHRSLYGGNDSLHSSGVFRYVSIRHTGINIGESTGNEIQGLTLGAVGAGTLLEYVESYSSDDDGFEFFGGTVNTRYLVSAFCADDAFDWDQGFRGKHQFWFAIQAADAAGRVAEMDGAGGNEQGTPYAHPVLSNITYIGAGTGATPVGDGSQLLMFRDNTGGVYMNSIFTDYQDKAITVEDVEDEAAEDSRKRLEGGDLVLAGNMWYGFAPGNMLADLAPQDYVQTHLTGNNNRIEDPMLRGISRETDAGLDPRPQVASPALSGALEMDDDYFVQTVYVGAFGGNNWLRDWTALDQLGYNGVTSITEDMISGDIPANFSLSQNYPNPFNPSSNIEYQLAFTSEVELSIFNILGQKVVTLVSGQKSAGTYKVRLDGSNLASGMYFYQLKTANNVFTKRMLLIK